MNLRPLNLKRRLPALLVAASLAAGSVPLVAAHPQEGPLPDERALVNDAARKAVKDGLEWLVRNQQEDGSWICNVGFKINDEYQLVMPNKPHVGVTALAGAAFLASGSTPGRGPYGKQVQGALDFVLACQGPDGFIGKHETRMYSHAFATMFLAEVHGMTGDRRVRDALQRAVEFTYKAQNRQGGWRYAPNSEDSDVSITVCQVVALRAAKNKGISVPKESVDAAVEYVLRSAVTENDGEFERGAFLYQYDSKNKQAAANTRTSFALTAAGLTTLYGAGVYSDQDIRDYVRNRKGLNLRALPDFKSMLSYVHRHYNATSRERPDHYFYWYGAYYGVQAMYIAGGEWWRTFYERLRDDLVRRQLPDGSWPNPRDQVGPAFATSVATLCLQVPNNYLPIFQR